MGGVNQAARLKLLLKNRIRRTRLGLGLKMKLAELPTAQRMDPLLIRTLYESEKRVAPATVALCDKLRNTNRYPHGTGLTKIDIEFLAHVTVATPSPQGPKSKMLCIGFTSSGRDILWKERIARFGGGTTCFRSLACPKSARGPNSETKH